MRARSVIVGKAAQQSDCVEPKSESAGLWTGTGCAELAADVLVAPRRSHGRPSGDDAVPWRCGHVDAAVDRDRGCVSVRAESASGEIRGRYHPRTILGTDRVAVFPRRGKAPSSSESGAIRARLVLATLGADQRVPRHMKGSQSDLRPANAAEWHEHARVQLARPDFSIAERVGVIRRVDEHRRPPPIVGVRHVPIGTAA
jgi:hypothetical protein